MIKIEQISEDIDNLPEEAQGLLIDFIQLLKKHYFPDQKEVSESQIEDWSDFIGCGEAEPDLSRNYKTYLNQGLGEKYDYR
jgi:hypothetical protein